MLSTCNQIRAVRPQQTARLPAQAVCEIQTSTFVGHPNGYGSPSRMRPDLPTWWVFFAVRPKLLYATWQFAENPVCDRHHDVPRPAAQIGALSCIYAWEKQVSPVF